MLMLPDADLDAAGDALVSRITERAAKIKIGPGNDPASEMGPLVTRAHRDEVADYVAGAAAQGADVVLDGRGFTVEGLENGHWMGMSLLDKVRTDSAFGDHGMYGSEAVHFYTRGKVITSRWPDPAETATDPDPGFPTSR
jgi:acyl-CoA reductase-like NAD-dependent aldehyde dehydrogenase